MPSLSQSEWGRAVFTHSWMSKERTATGRHNCQRMQSPTLNNFTEGWIIKFIVHWNSFNSLTAIVITFITPCVDCDVPLAGKSTNRLTPKRPKLPLRRHLSTSLRRLVRSFIPDSHWSYTRRAILPTRFIRGPPVTRFAVRMKVSSFSTAIPDKDDKFTI